MFFCYRIFILHRILRDLRFQGERSFGAIIFSPPALLRLCGCWEELFVFISECISSLDKSACTCMCTNTHQNIYTVAQMCSPSRKSHLCFKCILHKWLPEWKWNALTGTESCPKVWVQIIEVCCCNRRTMIQWRLIWTKMRWYNRSWESYQERSCWQQSIWA